MPDNQAGVEAPVKSSADAESFAEYKQLRKGAQVPAASTSQTQSEPPAPAKAKGESAAPSEGANRPQESPDSGNERHNAQDRIAHAKEREEHAKKRSTEIREAIAAAKTAEDEASRLEAELQQRKASPRPAAQPQAAEQPKPADDDPKPKLADFTSKPGVQYEDGLEQWEEACAGWRHRQQQKAQQRDAQERARGEVVRKLSEATTKVRAKYQDFDAVTSGKIENGVETGFILTPAMQHYVVENGEGGLEVMYHLAKDQVEYDRIKALPPVKQVAALGAIEWRLSNPTKGAAPAAAGTPAPATPLTSRVTPPPRIVSGTAPAEPRSTADAGSMEEHRRLRRAQRGQG